MAVRVFLAPGGTSRPATPRYGDSLTPRSSPNAAAVTTPSPSSTVSAASGRKAQVRQHQPSQHQAGTEPDSHSVPVVANHKRAAQPARRATPGEWRVPPVALCQGPFRRLVSPGRLW